MPYYYYLLLEKARGIRAIRGRGGVIYIIGSLKIDSESIRFNTLRFWHQFVSMRDIAYFCQAWISPSGAVMCAAELQLPDFRNRKP
jgi:hypothetical protein